MTDSQPSLFAVRDQREPGWFFVDNEILDRYGSDLGAYGVAVYNVLSRHTRNERQQVNLSNRDIAATLGISHDRVRKSLADLVNMGLIYLEVPDRPSQGSISTITLLKVKTTGRVASSSGGELDVWRPANKERKQKLNNIPPTPPSGGLTARQRDALRKEIDRIYKASVGIYQDEQFEERAIQQACIRLFLPLNLAKKAIAESRGEAIA
jgi:DNA-binding transcriptional MocR family regulator